MSRVQVEHLDGLAEVLRERLGVPVLLMVVEGREPVGTGQTAQYTNTGSAGMDSQAVFGLTAHLVAIAVEYFERERCDCPTCGDQLAKLRGAAEALGEDAIGFEQLGRLHA